MRKELDASGKIISDLLDFARERKPQRQPCPLRPLVDDVFSVVPPSGAVRLINDVREDLPVPNVDKDQFRQVLMNLVQNGMEAVAAKEGGEVRVEAEAQEGRISIVVKDNGQGIPPDVLEKIFQPLYTTKLKGTGLGLAVVSNTLSAHRATIRASSVVDAGTEFVIDLPLDAADTPPESAMTALAS
jgi:signal transduction histidine kinase